MIVESNSESCDETCGCSSRKKLKRVNDEEQVDRISTLPDSVLIHILSLLPTRDAIRTMIIPSFGRLWTSIYNLDFNWCLYHDCSENASLLYEYDMRNLVRFVDYVSRVVALHEGPKIDRFSLTFEFPLDHHWEELIQPETGERGLIDEVDKWIEFALKRNVEILDLDFIACGLPTASSKYELPAFLLYSSSLIELKLVSCNVNLSAAVYMKALKSLCLKEIALNDEAVKNILCGCPVLEKLSVLDCYGLCQLNCESKSLKSLFVSLDIVEESKVKIVCPYVTSLSISGWIERLELESLPSLQNASIDFSNCSCCIRDEYHEVRSILEKLHQVRLLTMYHQPILIVTMWDLMGLSCPSSSWQCLVLKTALSKWHLLGISNLLRNSPALETLDIDIILGENLPPTDVDSWHDLYVHREDCWGIQDKDDSFYVVANSLKTVTLSGNIKEQCVPQLVQLLLCTSPVLEKLIVSTKWKDHFPKTDNYVKFSEKLLSYPRASSNAVVVFAEG